MIDLKSPDKTKLVIALLILLITLFHYFTPTIFSPMHELYQVLYFVPIIISAFGFGLKGGVTAAGVVTVLYLPHIMFQWGGGVLMNLSRFLMIVLYNTLGALTGYLWGEERKQRQLAEQTSDQLKNSLEKLKRTSEELAQIEHQLRTAERLSTLGELTASLAHEVRNPLASIRGVAEILRDESDVPQFRKFVDILLQETQRLDGVVANYLSFARTQETQKKTVRIKEMIDSTLFLLKPELKKKNISQRVHISPEELTLSCDESQIRQALINILLNAVQASPPRGEISVSAVRSGQQLILTIADEGSGLPVDALQHVFEPFYTTKAEGTGLGLAISKRIVENHHGVIKAQNKESGGAEIILEFG